MKKYNFNLTMNTRDLGGYKTSSGKRTSFLKFIRSDALRYLNEDDLLFLKNNNFTTSIDLRTENVVNRFPSILANDKRFNYYNFPLVEGSGIPLTDENASRLYLQMVSNKQTYKDIFLTIYNSKGNIIFNCTAGKDRTGILSCLLLLLANVEREEIIKDYLYSEECIYTNIDKIRKVQLTFPKDLGHVKRKYIVDFLELFEEKYQNIEEYLLFIGLDKEQIDSIRNRLLGE